MIIITDNPKLPNYPFCYPSHLVWNWYAQSTIFQMDI